MRAAMVAAAWCAIRPHREGRDVRTAEHVVNPQQVETLVQHGQRRLPGMAEALAHSPEGVCEARGQVLISRLAVGDVEIAYQYQRVARPQLCADGRDSLRLVGPQDWVNSGANLRDLLVSLGSVVADRKP